MKLILLALVQVSAGLITRQPSNYGVKFGNYFSTGAVATNSWIREAQTTLILPSLNSPHTGNLALWPGMGTSNGNLIQGLAISTVGGGSPCGFTANEVKWCVVASTLQDNQEDGKPYKASPGDQITYSYKYNNATGKYDQSVAVNGTVVSTLSTSSGHAQGWGTAMECQMAACGTIPEHHYINTSITMEVADPNYSHTLGLNHALGSIVTKDGGKTWTVDDITIQKYTFT